MRRWSLLLTLVLASCANILDIEDRTLGGGSTSALCTEYCEKAKTNCTAADNAELFMQDGNCLGTCAEFPASDATTGNTLGCRISALNTVATLGEQAGSCPSAGPGGGAGVGGGTSCGSNCEGYCSLFANVCGTPIPDCLTKCPILHDNIAFNVGADYASGADTLQCRLAHLTAVAAAKHSTDTAMTDADKAALTQTHCGHSGLDSSDQCNVTDASMKPIECADFCKLVNFSCTGNNQVYQTDAQCLKVCSLLPSGKISEKLDNNVRCRREHAYNAFTATNAGSLPQECSNAGPVPALCGSMGKCESYCMLAKTACPADFKANYADDLAACQTSCGKLADSGQNVAYSTAAAATAGGSLGCRVLQVERVLGGDMQDATCKAAFGATPCQ